jgi:hypothetical protein
VAVACVMALSCRAARGAEPPADPSRWGGPLPDEGGRGRRSFDDPSRFVAGPISDGRTLSRHPSSPHPKACTSFYPKGVHEGAARVRLLVLIEPTGVASGGEIVDEAPEDQGFGVAALRCAASLTYEPALDAAGAKTRAYMTVTINFEDGD